MNLFPFVDTMTAAEEEHTGFIYSDTSALIALLIALLGSLLTFYNIYMHLSNFSRPKLQKHEVPLFACNSLTGWSRFMCFFGLL
jgi:heme/copper-type cytochrome/quinol oxidase subunit 1